MKNHEKYAKEISAALVWADDMQVRSSNRVGRHCRVGQDLQETEREKEMKNHEKYAKEISAALANAAYGPCGVQEMTLQTYLESGCVADFPDCETCPVHMQGVCPGYLQTYLESGCVADFPDCETCPVHMQGVCPGYCSTVAPDPDRVAEWLNAEVAA